MSRLTLRLGAEVVVHSAVLRNANAASDNDAHFPVDAARAMAPVENAVLRNGPWGSFNMPIRLTMATVVASALTLAAAPQALAQYPSHGNDGQMHTAPNRAPPNSAPGRQSDDPDGHKNQAVMHTPQFIIETRAEFLSTIVSATGDTAIDAPQKFTCSTTTCTIIISSDVQVQAATDGGNWAILGFVDGNFVTNSGYDLGVINVADSYVTGNSRQTVTVHHGAHTLQSFLYMGGGGTLYQYQIDYEVTAP